MSHRPTCTWDGSHRREDGKLELAFFRPLLELFHVHKGVEALGQALRPLSLSSFEINYDELWLDRAEAERLMQALAEGLGGEAQLLKLLARGLNPDLAGFRLPERDTGKRGIVEAVLQHAAQLLPGARFSVERMRLGSFDILVEPAGPASPLLQAYRRALFCAAWRQAGAWACRIRPLPGPPGTAFRERVLAPCLGWPHSLTLQALAAGALSAVAVLALSGPGLSSLASGALAALLTAGLHAGLLVQRRRTQRLQQQRFDLEHAFRRLQLRSLKRLQALVMDGNRDGVAVQSASGRWVYANQNLLTMLQVPVDRTVSADLAARLEPLLGPEQEGEAEAVWAPVEGGRLQALVDCLPALEGPGRDRVVRLRRLDAEELQRSDAVSRTELLAALIDHGQEALLILETDGSIRYGTPNLARLFGYDHRRLVGQGLEALFEPADAAEARYQIGLLRGGQGVSVRLCLRHGVSGRRWVQVGIDDRRQVAEIAGILLQLRDVTQMMEFEAAVVESEDSLRRSENFYRMIIEGSSDLVVLLDSQRRIIFANKTVVQALGHSPEEVRGKDVLAYIHPEDHEPALRAMAQAVEQSWAMLRLRLLQADGTQRLFEAHGRYTSDPDGRPIFVVAAHDVTRMDALERRAAQEGRLEAVGRLAGGVAHDFNNLLTVIQGNAELALGDEPAAVPKRVREIMDAAVRASELVQQLLTLGRKQVLQVRALDLAELLREHEGFIRRIMGSSVRLRLGLGTGVVEESLVVRAEPLSLTRALLNLAANAKEAMPEGGAFEILCSRHQVEAAEAAEHPDRGVGGYVRIDVRDTGVGMGPEVLARIFEPYFTTRGKGNGLGLSMVLGMVRQLGGFLAVESRPGEGSCFSLFLPEAGQAEPVAPAAPPPSIPPAKAEKKQRCVLVVDDESGVRRLAADGLRRQGYQVLEAADGEEALALWREARHHHHPIDLVLSDVIMPRMDGIQLCEMLQASDPQQPCLLMSGYYDAEKMVREGRSVGLTKPFTVQTLCSVVENALKTA